MFLKDLLVMMSLLSLNELWENQQYIKSRKEKIIPPLYQNIWDYSLPEVEIGIFNEILSLRKVLIRISGEGLAV